MYFKIYGIMTIHGFNTLVGNSNKLDSSLAKAKSLDPAKYPYFAITAHDNAQTHARTIHIGITSEGIVSGTYSLIEFKPNPMENAEAAQALFTKLDQLYKANADNN